MRALRGATRATRDTRSRPGAISALVLLALAAMLVLAGCSADDTTSGGIDFSLGLAGSTADQPSTPPTIASGGPSGTYAFVYDNQIWLSSGGEEAKQLTHLVLSNGATIRWGPLVWSPNGQYIAFVLVEDLNLNPNTATSTSGPIYYVHTDSKAKDYGAQILTPGTGSIYGHTYDWFGSTMLFYSNGSGIQLYTLGSSDPRAYQVRTIPAGPFGDSDYYFFGDIRYNSGGDGYVYYTRYDIRSPGRVGIVGSAALFRMYLYTPDYYSGLNEADMASAFPIGSLDQVASLGNVYADTTGTYVAGAWQIRNGNITLQNVQSVDTKAETVTSKVCTQAPYGGCGSNIVSKASKLPIAVHPQVALGANGKIAYCADNLYIVGQSDDSGACNWSVPPVWSSNGKALVFTQLVQAETDANGAVHYTTNIQVVQSGSQATTLIAGGQNLAWKP